MKTIGIITDAHANLPALEAALIALLDAGCDQIIHTGDAIGIGPHPTECLDRLLHNPTMTLLRGNHDDWFAFGLPTSQPSWISDEEWAHQQWTHAQIDPALRPVVAAWPDQLTLNIGSLTLFCCHYPPQRDGEGYASILREPTAGDFDALFAENAADLVFYGHHHPQSDLIGNARYVNPGALGCNSGPKARFAIVTVPDNDDWSLQFGSAPYDPTSVLTDLEQRQVPARETIRRIFFNQLVN